MIDRNPENPSTGPQTPRTPPATERRLALGSPAQARLPTWLRRSHTLVGLAAAGALAVLLLSWKARSPVGDVNVIGGELTYRVPRGDLLISFTERGNVKAAKSVPVYSPVEGVSTIVSLVSEGTAVKAGDLLVELDSSELTQLHNQQQITVDTALSDAVHAAKQLEIQRSLSESEVRQAELALTLADIDLQKYEEGDFKQAMTKANADKTIAEEELTRAKNQYEWTQKLAEKGYVTGTELIADRLAVRKAELQLENSRGALEVLQKWTHKKDQEKYRSDLAQAREALGRAKRKAESEITQAEAAKKAKESTLNLSRNRLQKVADQLDKTKVRAPQDGMVVYHTESWRRDRMIEQGAEVRENQLLMNLPDVSTMAVEVQVHESRIDQMREGLPAFVSVDALPNLNLKGRVTRVGILPDNVNRWMNPDLKVYLTEITIEDSEEVKLLRPGMSAKVQVIVTVLQDVIHVPVQSITTIDKQQACFVLESGQFVPRVVQGGKYNDAFIEITSGLKEGEIIKLNAPAPKGAGQAEGLEEAAALAAKAAEAGPAAGPPPAAPGGGGDGRRGSERRRRGGADQSDGVAQNAREKGQDIGRGSAPADPAGIAADQEAEGSRRRGRRPGAEEGPAAPAVALPPVASPAPAPATARERDAVARPAASAGEPKRLPEKGATNGAQ